MKKDSKDEFRIKTMKISEVPKEERIQFFIDYYLLKIIFISIMVAILLSALIAMLKPEPIELLNVAIFDEYLDEEVATEKENEVLELLSAGDEYIDEDIKVTFDSSYQQGSGIHKLNIYSVNCAVDVVIAPEETFKLLSELGYFIDVEDLVGDNEGFYSNGCLETDDGTGVGKGEYACYGAYVGDSQFYKDLGGKQESAVVGILVNSKRKENAEMFLNLILE